MPTATERVEAVFQPVPLLSKLTREEISALNGRLRVLYSGLRGRREATAVSMVESMDSTMLSVHATLFLGMLRTNAPERISNHLATLFSSQKIKGDTVRQTMVRVDQEARTEKSTEFFRDVLWDSFEASGPDYDAGLNVVSAYQALIWEDTRARFLEAVSGFDSFIKMLKYGGVQKAFSANDFETVDLIYGQPPPELLDIVENRENLITLSGFVAADFEQLRGVMINDFYAGSEGPIGARAIASKLRHTLGASGNIPKHKFLLWARTEGAIVQNDTLRAIGRAAEMNGKIWISVGGPNPPRRDLFSRRPQEQPIIKIKSVWLNSSWKTPS